jgi:hypothetical protein
MARGLAVAEAVYRRTCSTGPGKSMLHLQSRLSQQAPWQPCQQHGGSCQQLLGSPTPRGCPGGCSRPTYPSPSSTHRQFTGGRELVFWWLLPCSMCMVAPP